jgi:glycosyltransferase involved in cell wall biosynthesis/ubiquinone/menaquinone biosynthesis C-methylase UbiE/Tfp pilus assembly protein PilF
MKLKILSFNWHEPYLCLLARTGHEFLIVEPEIAPSHNRCWDEKMRSVPNNISLISKDIAKEMLELGEFDLIIAHNMKDLIEVREYSLPKIFVFHNCLTTEITLGKNQVNREAYLEKMKFLLKDVNKVFISEKKQRDWGLNGEVILPGLDILEYGGYRGDKKIVLQVGNLLQERGLMMGYTTSKKIIENHPLITLGMNPNISDSRLSEGFHDLIENYRSCRVFINTTVDEYEDGYNLSMLEAMATGMPVVSSWNKSSPIVEGKNGYISNDTSYLNQCIKFLLANSEKAKMIGEQAKITVQERFPLNRFLNSWEKVIQKSVLEFLSRTGVNLTKTTIDFQKKVRKNILMDFVSYPATTAHYLERAFRKNHNVITCGSKINEEVIKLWNLESLNWEITPQDIYRGNKTTLEEVVKELPDLWEPDFYLWVETGLSDIPGDLKQFSFPKVCYLIDTHIHFGKHLEISRNFDFVFLAQKAYVQPMIQAGIKNVVWLPLACDPEIHGKVNVLKKCDVGFVGSVSSKLNRRKNLLDKIQKQFDLDFQRKFMNEMAEHYSASRIVFNNAINNDLNMRVFEALCSGSMLVTDRALGSGLDELFTDRKHLVVYDDERIEQTITYYLNNKSERERIASEGRKEVLAQHTYCHRTDTMIRILDKQIGSIKQMEPILMNNKSSSYYENVRNDLIHLIPMDAKYILEVGCAFGMTGRELKKRNGAFVAGLELNVEAARAAKIILDDVVEGDIEKIDLPYSDDTFDCILFADVLEHLVDPLSALLKVKRLLKKEGSIVASIPNVQFHGVIHKLIEGNWTYEEEGILDNTHLRFFTYKEIIKLFSKAGYFIQKVEEVLDPQYEKFLSQNTTTLNFGRTQVKDLSPEEIKRFFVFQYQVIATPININKNGVFEKYEGGERLSQLDHLLLQASEELDSEKLNSALKHFGEVIKISPENTEALIGMGDCYMKLQTPDKADTLYDEACLKEPNNPRAWLHSGLLALHNNNIKKADICFNKCLDEDTNNDKAYCGLGVLRFNANDFDGAVDYFCKSLDANPENLSACKFLLELSYKLKDFAKVEIYLSRYIEFHPANLNMRFALAGIQYKRGKIEDSINNLECILALNPKHESAQEMLDNIRTDVVLRK